ncbi:MAG: ribosome small subunit-dependent GTPase A [Acidimicrobiia bacterium]|nr:ribosome small subunit-dependent GTPase A [Acidimicrobiia bacterium]
MPVPLEPPASPQAELDQYGWNQSVADRYQPFARPDRQPGRIVRVDRGEANVALGSGLVRCDISRPPSDPESAPIPAATGDWVAVIPADDRLWDLAAIVPRVSAIERLDPAGNGMQVLAANLDKVIILSPMDRPAKPSLIERALVVVWESGALPVIVLAKADLADGGEHGESVAALTAATAELAPGVEVIPASATTGFGLQAVHDVIGAGDTIGLIGESGVGKSTLANALVGSDLLATGETRSDGAGRHTTAVRELVPMRDGAVLIDTPGLRSLGLSDQVEGMALAFSDIERFAEDCRFRDCAHQAEPGCAVLAAVETGELTERRLQSYRHLLGEVAHEERRSDQRRRRSEERGADLDDLRTIRGTTEW